MLPKLEYEKTGGEKGGRPAYRVTVGGVYESEGYTIKIPVGYISDLASIPHIFFLLRPNDPRWAIPAIIHDRACTLSRNGVLPAGYRVADAILYNAMREAGAGVLYGFVFWAFVRFMHIVKYNIDKLN